MPELRMLFTVIALAAITASCSAAGDSAQPHEEQIVAGGIGRGPGSHCRPPDRFIQDLLLVEDQRIEKRLFFGARPWSGDICRIDRYSSRSKRLVDTLTLKVGLGENQEVERIQIPPDECVGVSANIIDVTIMKAVQDRSTSVWSNLCMRRY